MPTSYNLEDILAEVDEKHSTKKPPIAAPLAEPAPEPQPLVVSTEEILADDFTRVTKEIQKPSPAPSEGSGAVFSSVDAGAMEQHKQDLLSKIKRHEISSKDDDADFSRFKRFKKERIKKAKGFDLPPEDELIRGIEQERISAEPDLELGKKHARTPARLDDAIAQKAAEIERNISQNAEKKEVQETIQAEKKDILAELRHNQKTLRRRTFQLFVAFLLSLYLYAAGQLEIIPIINVFKISWNPLPFALFAFIIMFFAAIRSQAVIIGGIISAIRLKPDRDTIPAVAAAACLIQNIWAMFFPEVLVVREFKLMMSVGIVILLFNAFAKLSIIKQSIRNYHFLGSKADKYAVSVISSAKNSENFTRGLFDQIPRVVMQKKFSPSEDFIYRTFEKNATDRTSMPVFWGSLIVAFAMAIIAGIMNGKEAAVTAFTLVLCASNALGLLFMLHIPQRAAGGRLGRLGVLIGYDTFEQFASANNAVMPARQLFSPEYVEMVGIKTFAGKRIDEAIVEAASALSHADSILTGVFMNIIGGKTEMLLPAENLVYEDGLGICAWIGGERILIGNRDMMINHNVEVTSRDYEAKYLADGNDVIYLASGGVLAAVFVLRLKAADNVKASLELLAKHDVYVSVYSVDSMITAKKISSVFELPENMFKVISSRYQDDYQNELRNINESEIPLVISDDFDTYAKAIVCSKCMNIPVMLARIVYIAAVVLGVVIAAYEIWSGGVPTLGLTKIFGWQLAWFAAVLGVGLVR